MKIKNRITCITLALCIALALAGSAFAAFDDSKLTWDGKPTT